MVRLLGHRLLDEWKQLDDATLLGTDRAKDQRVEVNESTPLSLPKSKSVSAVASAPARSPARYRSVAWYVITIICVTGCGLSALSASMSAWTLRGCDEITGLAVDVQELAQPSGRELRVVEPSAEGDELFAHGDALAGQRWFEDQPSIGHEPISDGGEVSEPAGHVDGRSSELAGTENVLVRQVTTQSDQQPRPEWARLGRNAVQRLAEHRGDVMVDSPTERRTSGDP